DNNEPDVAVVPFSTTRILLDRPWGLASHTRLLDMATGKDVARCVHDRQLIDIAISHDGRHIATVGDEMVRVWDAQSGAQVATLRGHEAYTTSARFSPDGKHLVSGGNYPECALRIWNVARAEPIADLRGHGNRIGSIAFSPDGTRIASGSWDQTVRL